MIKTLPSCKILQGKWNGGVSSERKNHVTFSTVEEEPALFFFSIDECRCSFTAVFGTRLRFVKCCGSFVFYFPNAQPKSPLASFKSWVKKKNQMST